MAATSTAPRTLSEQIDAANDSDRTPVVFVHGLGLLRTSWQPWEELWSPISNLLLRALPPSRLMGPSRLHPPKFPAPEKGFHQGLQVINQFEAGLKAVADGLPFTSHTIPATPIRKAIKTITTAVTLTIF